jgi:hypothetical protein
MHKYRFCQVYCIDLLKGILMKFSLYVSKLYTVHYEFSKFNQISWKLNWKTEFEKKENTGTVSGRLLAQGWVLLAWPSCILAQSAHAQGRGTSAPKRWSPRPRCARWCAHRRLTGSPPVVWL